MSSSIIANTAAAIFHETCMNEGYANAKARLLVAARAEYEAERVGKESQRQEIADMVINAKLTALIIDWRVQVIVYLRGKKEAAAAAISRAAAAADSE